MVTAPDAVEYVPAEQLLHAVDPDDDEYDPATHVRHDADEFAAHSVEYVPESQLTHVALLDAPDVLEYLPVGQPVQFVANNPAKVPAGHVLHAADDDAP